MPGGAPDAAAKDAILKQVWQPYHAGRLPLNWHACEKIWLCAVVGCAPIKSVVPRLFEGAPAGSELWYGGRRQLFDAAQRRRCWQSCSAFPTIIAGYSMAALKADVSPVTMAVPSTIFMPVQLRNGPIAAIWMRKLAYLPEKGLRRRNNLLERLIKYCVAGVGTRKEYSRARECTRTRILKNEDTITRKHQNGAESDKEEGSADAILSPYLVEFSHGNITYSLTGYNQPMDLPTPVDKILSSTTRPVQGLQD